MTQNIYRDVTPLTRICVLTDGYQATDVFYKWNSRNSTGDVVYIAEDLEMPQFMITNVELEERTNIYNIGMEISVIQRGRGMIVDVMI